MAKIAKIEGIGPVYGEKLRGVGITTVEALLEAAASPKGRQELAEKTEITEKLILEWANLADLFRFKGVGEEYSDLLEEAGVDTVVELARRNPENLYNSLKEINDEKKLVRALPGPNQVKSWVEQAKELPRVMTY
jgi:predicted flap endonuclease-1-like 5' DNA nuclease